MNRMLPLFIGLCVIVASPFALAQDNRVEINGVVGYTFSSGVDVEPILIDGTVYNRISPKSGMSFGVGGDFFLTEGWSIGFQWNREDSALRGDAQGAPDKDFTSMNVDNYHGIFTYNIGYEDSPVRPYIFGGIGATYYGPGQIDSRSVDSATKFSTTWGGGVKVFTSEHFGFRGGFRWTPTYIGSTPGGVWCSWYYCWQLSDAHYSHQFELSGGIIARF